MSDGTFRLVEQSLQVSSRRAKIARPSSVSRNCQSGSSQFFFFGRSKTTAVKRRPRISHGPGVTFAGSVQLPYEICPGGFRCSRIGYCKSRAFSQSRLIRTRGINARARLDSRNLPTSVTVPPGDGLLAHLEGWDSLKSVRLVLRLEEIVGHELSEDDIEKLQSIEGPNDLGFDE